MTDIQHCCQLAFDWSFLQPPAFQGVVLKITEKQQNDRNSRLVVVGIIIIDHWPLALFGKGAQTGLD